MPARLLHDIKCVSLFTDRPCNCGARERAKVQRRRKKERERYARSSGYPAGVSEGSVSIGDGCYRRPPLRS